MGGPAKCEATPRRGRGEGLGDQAVRPTERHAAALATVLPRLYVAGHVDSDFNRTLTDGVSTIAPTTWAMMQGIRRVV
jgi:hypothetical protein